MSIFFFQVETMASGLAKVCQPSFALAELKWLFFGGQINHHTSPGVHRHTATVAIWISAIEELGHAERSCHHCDNVCDRLSQKFSIMGRLNSWSKVKYITGGNQCQKKTCLMWFARHQYNHELKIYNVPIWKCTKRWFMS